jgi:hypothetical protein
VKGTKDTEGDKKKAEIINTLELEKKIFFIWGHASAWRGGWRHEKRPKSRKLLTVACYDKKPDIGPSCSKGEECPYRGKLATCEGDRRTTQYPLTREKECSPGKHEEEILKKTQKGSQRCNAPKKVHTKQGITKREG